MTFSDMKVAVFVNKIANCRKSATVRPSHVGCGGRDFGRFCRGGCSYGGICVLADATWDPIAWRLNNDFSRSLRHCRWNFSSPVTEKIVLLHPKIHCLMRKGFALFVLLIVAAVISPGIFAQKVYSCQYKSDADVKVFVSQYKSDADLVVYETKWKSEATDNSGIWYFCKYKSDADRKIYFCDYKSDADIVIYFSKYKSDAGWKKNEKKHLMYKKN